MQSLRNLKAISRILIFALLHLCWLVSYSWAEMVPTESVIPSPTPTSIPSDRQRLLGLLQREDIQTKLQKYGISREEAVVRINSLSDQELSEIGSKVKLVAGGHDVVEEALSDLFLMIFLWVALIGFIALAYFIGLLFKSIACPFQDECGDVLRPWWDPDDGYEYEGGPPAPIPSVNPPEPPAEPPPPIGSGGNGGVYIPGGECDAREQACEWSVR